MGSTVNPMGKGGEEYKGLWEDSRPNERNNNGRTRSGLYRIFIPAYEALEGFDKYGNASRTNRITSPTDQPHKVSW